MSVEMQRRLQEAITTFENLLNPHDKERALSAWTDVAKTFEGQKALLQEARAGNLDAINYLYLNLLPQITSVFWKNFLGPNPGFRRQRLDQGDQFVFASMVYQSLLSSYLKNLPKEEALDVMKKNIFSKSPRATITDEDIETQYDYLTGSVVTPLDTFDPSGYKEGVDLVAKFGFYLMGTLKNEAKKYNRKEQLGGIAVKKLSKGEKEDVKNVSFEAHFENDEDTASHDQADFLKMEDLDAWELFVQDEDLDSGKSPTARDVLKEFLAQGGKFDVAAVASSFGVTPMTVRNRLSSIKPILQKHSITSDTFGRLITSQSGKTLAETL